MPVGVIVVDVPVGLLKPATGLHCQVVLAGAAADRPRVVLPPSQIAVFPVIVKSTGELTVTVTVLCELQPFKDTVTV